jgi:hypothetical protein
MKTIRDAQNTLAGRVWLSGRSLGCNDNGSFNISPCQASIIRKVTSSRVRRTKHVVCRLGGVVVSVLDTGPKVCGFEPGQGDGFLRAIKILSTHSSRMGSKAGGPMS